MYLKQIQLTNIGPYRGIHSIDLDTSNRKNTILIGGENGAGKTTFLNSIKIGLFGSFAFGFKTENKDYFKKVGTLLNHIAVNNEENNFRIKLDFDIVDDLSKKSYSLFRAWKIKNDNIKEQIDIIEDGKHLTEYEKDIFQSKIREIMPPHLLDLCLFDGEEISRIINNNQLSLYLEKLTYVLFNLDLFDVLENDLNSYSQQNEVLSNLNKQEKEHLQLIEEKNTITHKLNQIDEQLSHLLLKEQELEESYQNVKNDFKVHGGLAQDERDKINQKMIELENVRKQNHELIRQFVSNSLPFFLAKDVVNETRAQLMNEEKYQLYTSLEKNLTHEKLSQLLTEVQATPEKEDILKQGILSTVKPSDEIAIIHGASFSESRQIENVYEDIRSDRLLHQSKRIEENKKKLKDIQNLREKQKVNDASSEFSDMLSSMEKYSQKLNIVKSDIEKHNEIKDELIFSLKKVNSAIEAIELNFKDQEKSRNSFVESQKIISLSRKFRVLQLKKKLQEVQIEATKMLNKLMRKQNYISSLKVDPVSFEVSLYDQNGDPMEKSTLSAGEKEILLLSISWAIFKSSGRNVPFIFDTLLGRLDRTHKNSLLTHYIPHCGRQAIILSTDAEIDEKTYELLHTYTAKEYTLDFNVVKKETNILSNYFSFKRLEV
ncbi:DNA sulfur modification protein DndD [Metabacillus sp. RGM 3146]|uniref:DNA sulfur modification protein DndD n=1 Tax=Metabacillus sp. RGM 3146 TaxID=3401092 RepID=UPI003B991EE5